METLQSQNDSFTIAAKNHLNGDLGCCAGLDSSLLPHGSPLVRSVFKLLKLGRLDLLTKDLISLSFFLFVF